MIPRFLIGAALALGLAGCGYEDDAEALRLALLARARPPDRISFAWVRLNNCVAQMERATFTWRTYRNLLEALKDERYLVVPMREFAAAREANPGKVVVALRHDMDGNFCKAETMAALEAEHGFRSTYFVRHTDPYYAYGWPRPERRRDLLPRLEAIQARGHEVGLHFDILTLALRYGLDPAEVLGTELAYLRGGGLDVTGLSHHGSGLAKRLRFQNYEFFAGMTTRDSITYRGREVRLGRRSLAEFDLAYEAYHFENDHYFSDVSGRWNSESPLDGLPKVKPGEGVIILTHPVWWGSEDDGLRYY